MKFNEGRRGVELHIHLDGAFRPSTVFKFAKLRGFPVPGANENEFENHLIVKQPNSLASFLKTFDYLLPPIAGSAEAIAQTTLDFLEDCVNKAGLCYVEPRFSPQLLQGTTLSADEVTKTVLDALERSSQKFDIQYRAILCTMRQNPEWSDEVLSLAKAYQPHGIVAVDVAGDDKGCTGTNTDNRIKNALREAKACGLHCLVHAGENGSAASVSEAVYDMFAERIGHGYHILDNASIYSDMKSKNVHFEVCPLSSRLTGSVSCDWSQHPVHYFIRDGINFSISTDDPTVTGQWLIEEEKMLLTKVGLTAEQLKAANLRAAKACFLGGEDKEDLLRHICARRDSANICA